MKRSDRQLIEEIIQAECHGMFDALVEQIDERDKALQKVIDRAVIDAVHGYLGMHMQVSIKRGTVS